MAEMTSQKRPGAWYDLHRKWFKTSGNTRKQTVPVIYD
jgi:hypothetical protein